MPLLGLPRQSSAFVTSGGVVRRKKSIYARRIQRSWRRYKSRASRFRGPSRARAEATMAVSKAMANYAENKFQGSKINALMPVSKPAGTQPIKYHFINTSKSIAGLLPEFANPMNLFRYERGDGAGDRDGDYLYVRNSALTLQVQANSIDDDVGTANGLNNDLQFRMMIVKSNKKYQPFASTADPGNNLFLSVENKPFGYDQTGQNTFDYMVQPINKRRWIVYCDKKFTLSPPCVAWDSSATATTINASSGKYNHSKTLRFNCNVNKKCYFDTDAVGDNAVPTNVDGDWFIILQGVRSAYNATGATAPSNRAYTLTINGCTTARDS